MASRGGRAGGSRGRGGGGGASGRRSSSGGRGAGRSEAAGGRERVRREPRRPREPRRARSELTSRIIVAIPAIAFASTIIALGGIWFTVAVIVLGILCLGELFDLYAEVEPVRLAGFVGVAGVILAAYLGDGFHVLLAAMAFFPVLFAVTLRQRQAGTLGMAVTMFGVAWIGLSFAHGVLLRELPHGGAILVDILVGTFVGDSGAYLGGRWFGQRKLAPSVSPNKTVEGLAIGMFTAVLATWLAGTYQDWLSGGDAILLGLGVAVAAPVGDLFESFVKRDAGTKDTGRLFGAHGGALDRLDAVMFSVVAGYYIWLALS
ncbi:MAG TPA: phosphatidate cytidylyltransferase [Solirubrobacteraceae bacterium]|jgi:phosphatidate cytidylyltransferase|nr:phosphatidate cytidylyltransferase [Solirubrobacteraceae bacterium]